MKTIIIRYKKYFQRLYFTIYIPERPLRIELSDNKQQNLSDIQRTLTYCSHSMKVSKLKFSETNSKKMNSKKCEIQRHFRKIPKNFENSPKNNQKSHKRPTINLKKMHMNENV